ncbi:RHS repeat-associated core domain-containing protein [Longispora albida]|uniref:RHS repeat-associated core domain-containing protein n=1 Tax=Longispora albida TaxID=203523 RepID=UPI000376DB88|nr:RHS repeat-associated core domain-containing protein [Longispora albida]
MRAVRRARLSRVLHRGLAVAMAAGLLAGVADSSPALAAPYSPGKTQKEKPVAGTVVRPGTAQAGIRASVSKPDPQWPSASTVDVDLAAGGGQRLAPGQRFMELPSAVRAAGTPVAFSSPAGAAVRAPSKVQIKTRDRAAASAAGVDGLVFDVRSLDGAGQATVSVDYSAFQSAHGADWASRLRLIELPGCALTTPGAPGCEGRPVPSVNSPESTTVSAAVPLSAEADTTLALAPGTAGPAGSFEATTLSPSSTWTAGGNSGEFSWSYPLRSPPAMSGPVPSVKFRYSSSSVDGKVAASNNQPSWIGEGFDYSPGFVERRYRNCADDMTGGNNTKKTGDSCWAADNATLSLNGRTSELIKDSGNRWRSRSDDGTLIERVTGAVNGAKNGEHWQVTTPDGTKYVFGKSAPATLTAPVYGNHEGEDCHAAAFKDSDCVQGYRWNLESVEDPHKNTMTYVYAKETNKYAREGTTTDLVSYDRDSYLTRIDYGTRSDRTETAPFQVVFTTSDRCLSDCTKFDATHWPDTPVDLECKASPCYVGSPTFWSKKRLTGVLNKAGGKDVESWTLTQSFPDPGDGTRGGLWLDKISHVGLAGTRTPVPDITFEPVQLPNRVDTHSDQYPAMKWHRIKSIITETGAKTTVEYSSPDCVPGSRMPDPAKLAENKLRCYPVYWTPDGELKPILDYFHKYVVTDVTEADPSGGAVRAITHYDYAGDPGWRYADDDGLVKPASRTWSGWRGYAEVRTTKGDPGEQSVSVSRYFRGLDGDKFTTGTRSVKLPAIATGGVPETPDEDAYAGMTRESIIYNGTAEVSATVNVPWQSDPTATRTINGWTVHARHGGIGAVHTRTALDGGRAPRTTTTKTAYDDHGMPFKVDNAGDDAVTGDETCGITDYARNTTAWLTSFVSRQRSYAVSCAKAAVPAKLTEADVLSDNLTDYDGKANGVAPAEGEPTKTWQLKAFTAGQPSYITATTTQFDVYGRAVLTSDIKKNTSKIEYTPALGGPVTQTLTTDAMGWQTSSTVDPAWGAPVLSVDSNGRRTEMAYDGLGRLLSVWQPGRDRAQVPNISYEYLVRSGGTTAVHTRKLNATGGQFSMYTLYDSMLRPRQTQSANGAGGSGVVVTDTFYDSAGRASAAHGMYLALGSPGPDLFRPTQQVPNRSETTFDGAGRPVASTLKVNGTVRSRSTTAYGGDRVDVTPAAGGTPTSTLKDAAGRTVEFRQYHAGETAGSANPADYDATRYTFNRKGQRSRVTDPAGNSWGYEYDLWGRTVKTTDPDRGTTETKINDFGEVTSVTDARKITLYFGYDKIGRKTSVREGAADGPLRLSWDFDTLPSGEKVNGKLVRSTRFIGAEAYVKETTGFTADYQPSAVKYTIPAAGVNGTYTYVYTYNQDGTALSQRIPAAGDLAVETLGYGYDGMGRPVTLDSGYGTRAKTTLVAGSTYTSFSELGTYSLRNEGGNTVDITRHYEEGTRRLDQIWTSKQTGPATISDVRYSYDLAGNVSAISDLTSGDNQCFRSDYLQRLTEAWTPAARDCKAAPTAAGLGGPAKYWQKFTLDVLGNRTQQVEHGTTAGDRTTVYTPEAGSHALAKTVTTDNSGTRTGTYTYDAAGNTETRPAGANGTQTLLWDAEGHLASSTDKSGTSSYVYDADGSRLIRKDPSGTTLYLPGQEIRFNGTAKTGTRYYTHGGQTAATRTSTGLTWLVQDSQGTTQVTVNAVTQAVSSRRSTPFGTERNVARSWPASLDRGLVGGTKDSTGLTHLGAREYDPAIGRFVSPDPVMDLSDPQQWQAYLYANNSPVTFSDPSGLCWWDICNKLKLFGAGVIAFGGAKIGEAVVAGVTAGDHGLDAITGSRAQSLAEGLGGPFESSFHAVKNRKGTPDDPTAYGIGMEWASGKGPKHRDLKDGDRFVTKLQEHGHVQKTRELIADQVRSGELKVGGSDSNRYSLGGGFTQSAKKFYNDMTNNLSAGLLGSYSLEYTLIGVDKKKGTATVAFRITNSSTMASATRLPPPIGYSEFYKKHVNPMLNNYFPSGQGSEKTQTVTWTEEVRIAPDPAPPIRGNEKRGCGRFPGEC